MTVETKRCVYLPIVVEYTHKRIIVKVNIYAYNFIYSLPASVENRNDKHLQFKKIQQKILTLYL